MTDDTRIARPFEVAYDTEREEYYIFAPTGCVLVDGKAAEIADADSYGNVVLDIGGSMPDALYAHVTQSEDATNGYKVEFDGKETKSGAKWNFKVTNFGEEENDGGQYDLATGIVSLSASGDNDEDTKYAADERSIENARSGVLVSGESNIFALKGFGRFTKPQYGSLETYGSFVPSGVLELGAEAMDGISVLVREGDTRKTDGNSLGFMRLKIPVAAVKGKVPTPFAYDEKTKTIVNRDFYWNGIFVSASADNFTVPLNGDVFLRCVGEKAQSGAGADDDGYVWEFSLGTTEASEGENEKVFNYKLYTFVGGEINMDYRDTFLALYSNIANATSLNGAKGDLTLVLEKGFFEIRKDNETVADGLVGWVVESMNGLIGNSAIIGGKGIRVTTEGNSIRITADATKDTEDDNPYPEEPLVEENCGHPNASGGVNSDEGGGGGGGGGASGGVEVDWRSSGGGGCSECNGGSTTASASGGPSEGASGQAASGSVPGAANGKPATSGGSSGASGKKASSSSGLANHSTIAKKTIGVTPDIHSMQNGSSISGTRIGIDHDTVRSMQNKSTTPRQNIGVTQKDHTMNNPWDAKNKK